MECYGCGKAKKHDLSILVTPPSVTCTMAKPDLPKLHRSCIGSKQPKRSTDRCKLRLPRSSYHWTTRDSDGLPTALSAPTWIKDIRETNTHGVMIDGGKPSFSWTGSGRWLSALYLDPGSLRGLRVAVPVDWVDKVQEARGLALAGSCILHRLGQVERHGAMDLSRCCMQP
ncbi:hypothetical protein XPA_001393 [Xanthoria parietina]